MKNDCWIFERLFKIQENAAFLFEISLFVLKIVTFLYYGNTESRISLEILEQCSSNLVPEM